MKFHEISRPSSGVHEQVRFAWNVTDKFVTCTRCKGYKVQGWRRTIRCRPLAAARCVRGPMRLRRRVSQAPPCSCTSPCEYVDRHRGRSTCNRADWLARADCAAGPIWLTVLPASRDLRRVAARLHVHARDCPCHGSYIACIPPCMVWQVWLMAAEAAGGV